LFALAVILIPLLIHLFHFKKYKTLYFSSLTFLKSVEQEQRNLRKLKQWLIFACRALCFAFLVFAFAQPYIPLKSKAKESGKHVIAIYVDNSFSTSRLGESGELLSQSKELAKSVVQDAPRDAQFLLITNELGSEEKQTLNKASCLDKIEDLTYSPLVRSAATLTSWWQEWLSETEKSGVHYAEKQLVYLSDFQKSTFGKLRNFEPNEWKGQLYPIQLKPVKEGNLYIDSIWFASPIHKKDSKQIVYARVVNSSDEAIKDVEVSFQIGTLNRDVYADIPSNGADTVEVSYFNSKAGKTAGYVRINDKQMTQDDAFYFSFDVKKNGKVLILDGEEAVENVAKVYRLDDYYQIQQIPQSQLTATTTKDVDLVVVNGSNNLPSTSSQYLFDFAKNGGTLLLIPGSNPTPSGWNNLLTKVQMPGIAGMQESGLALKKININDSYFEGVFERKPENISLPLVKKAVRLSSNKTNYSVALINHQNGSPFLLKGIGDYSVYFISTPLKEEYSSFTSNQLFSTILLRTGELSQRQAPYFLLIGESAKFPVTLQDSEIPMKMESKQISFIPQIYNVNNESFLQIQGIEAVRQLEAGNYKLVQGKSNLGICSVNYNRLESKTNAYNETGIQEQFEKAGIPVEQLFEAKDWSGASFLNLDQPVNYWKWCLIIALLFLLAEMVIVIFVKK
jgi:hypothetical protein